MKTLPKSVLLSCLLSLFIGSFFADAVYGQRNRAPQRNQIPPTKVVKAFCEYTNQWQWEQQLLERGQWITCRIFDEETGRWEWIIDGNVPGARITSWNIPAPPPVRGTAAPRPAPQGTGNHAPQRFRLVPGDVILEINGEWINRQEDVTSAIARSPQTMYLTVRDGRTGGTALYVTTLNANRPRFGVNHRTHPGGGSRVTGVNPNSPATRIFLAE